MIASAIGFGLSALVHFCSIFDIFQPPRELILIINVGVFLVAYPTFIIVKNVRDQLNLTDFKQAVFDVCPKHLLTLNGLIIMYAIVGLLFFIFKNHFTADVGNNSQEVIKGYSGFTGHWMAIYSLTFTLLYSCKRLKDMR